MSRSYVGVVGLVLVLGGLTSCSSGPTRGPTAQAYLAAWSRGDLAAAAAQTTTPAVAQAALEKTTKGLSLTRIRATLGRVSTHGSTATAAFTVTATLAGLGDWRYTGSLALQEIKNRWQVSWQPSDIHPRLAPGLTLARTRALGPRAPIEDASGQPLFTDTPVVTVGVEPDQLTDVPGELATLAGALHIDAAATATRVAQAKPRNAFIPLITLRRSDYAQVKSMIYQLPGVLFRASTKQLAPTADFARALLGQVGPATAQALRRAGSPYEATDTLGIGGLQETFQARLAGTAHGAVLVVDASGKPVATLHSFAGTAGIPVRTTLDPRMQQAADQALAAVGKPAALVAIRPSDGAVLAVANTPAGAYDRALVGRYPPGSTFKVVSSYALLGKGVTPQTPVPCPPQISVEGKVFHNFEGEARATAPPFATDFVISCNTAFIGASKRLGNSDLATAAGAFGLGAHWSLPLTTFSGSVPPASSPVELAADTIGQGTVLVSPLALATVAGAVSAGTARAPVLVTDPAQTSTAVPPTLDATVVAQLRTLMGQVVSDPAGTVAGAKLPAGTHGKTGTAEFGTANPPQTHAWFIGYRGDLAFAVLVEAGGVGGAVAAPIAASFLGAVGAS